MHSNGLYIFQPFLLQRVAHRQSPWFHFVSWLFVFGGTILAYLDSLTPPFNYVVLRLSHMRTDASAQTCVSVLGCLVSIVLYLPFVIERFIWARFRASWVRVLALPLLMPILPTILGSAAPPLAHSSPHLFPLAFLCISYSHIAVKGSGYTFKDFVLPTFMGRSDVPRLLGSWFDPANAAEGIFALSLVSLGECVPGRVRATCRALLSLSPRNMYRTPGCPLLADDDVCALPAYYTALSFVIVPASSWSCLVLLPSTRLNGAAELHSLSD